MQLGYRSTACDFPAHPSYVRPRTQVKTSFPRVNVSHVNTRCKDVKQSIVPDIIATFLHAFHGNIMHHYSSRLRCSLFSMNPETVPHTNEPETNYQLAYQPRQALGAPRAWNDPQTRFCQPQHRISPCDTHIARQHQLEPAPICRA